MWPVATRRSVGRPLQIMIQFNRTTTLCASLVYVIDGSNQKSRVIDGSNQSFYFSETYHGKVRFSCVFDIIYAFKQTIQLNC